MFHYRAERIGMWFSFEGLSDISVSPGVYQIDTWMIDLPLIYETS
jgi:hypothetical protein